MLTLGGSEVPTVLGLAPTAEQRRAWNEDEAAERQAITHEIACREAERYPCLADYESATGLLPGERGAGIR